VFFVVDCANPNTIRERDRKAKPDFSGLMWNRTPPNFANAWKEEERKKGKKEGRKQMSEIKRTKSQVNEQNINNAKEKTRTGRYGLLSNQL